MLATQSGVPLPKKVLASSTGGLLVVVIWGAHILIRSSYQPGEPVRVALTLALTLAFGLYVFLLLRLVSALDEYQKQMHTMALSIAFPLSLIAIFALGFLSREGWFVQSDTRDLAGMMILFYLIGYVIARWRFR